MLFQTKKIVSETLGEYLHEVRENLHFSAKDVSTRLGIKLIFLKALEAGDFSKLPPDVYTLGFLKLLAPLYAIDADLLIAQYKRERDIQRHLQENKTLALVGKNWLLERLVITPKIMSVLLGLLFVAVTVIYVVWQVFSINRTPNLEIFEPKDHQVISGSFVNVVGKTDPGIMVAINDQNVFVDNQGNFKIQLGINPGLKDVVFVAKNKFDKTVKKTIIVVGQIENKQEQSQVKLELNFLAEVDVGFNLDDGPQQAAKFALGDSKILTARNKIVLSTSNAGAVKVKLNGKDLGALGKSGEKLDNIPFFAESAKIEVK